jgi:opacity protein-like surface antigen
MHMKKLISLAILLISITNSALASSTSENTKNFSGPAIAIGLSSVGTHSKFKSQTNSGNSEYSYGERQFIGVANASYLKDVGEKWLIGGGATYDLNPLKTKGASYYDVTTGNFNTSIKSNGHFSIYVQPTYSLNESTALFFKAGYHKTRINLQDNFNYVINSYSKNLHGFGFGAGAMIFLDKNVFTKLEIEFVNYSKVNMRDLNTARNVSYQLSTTSGTLSIGYRF